LDRGKAHLWSVLMGSRLQPLPGFVASGCDLIPMDFWRNPVLLALGRTRG
jgi:hypothetical protein